MKNVYRSLNFLVFSVFIFLAPIPALAQLDDFSKLLPAAKYDVGYREVLVETDGSVYPVNGCGHPNAIKMSIWYPIEKIGNGPTPPPALFQTSACVDGSDSNPINNIDPFLGIPMANEVPLLSTISYQSKKAYDGTNLPIAHNKKFPVMLFSHGLNTDGWFGSTLFETVAAHGYVVVSPYFKGTSLKDVVFRVTTTLSPLNDNKLVRIPVMNFTTDWVIAENDNPASFLFNRIATDKIGVLGYSRGGEAVLTWGAEGLHPAIKAVIVGQPLATVVEQPKLSNLTVPTMLLAGSTGRNIAHYQTLYPAIGTSEKYKFLIEIQGTAHLQVGDPCHVSDTYASPARNAYLNSPYAAGFPSFILNNVKNAYTGNVNEGCLYVSPPPIPTLAHQKVIDLYAMYIVAFFDTYGSGAIKHDGGHDASGKDKSDEGNKLSNRLSNEFAIDNNLPIIMIHDGVMTTPDYQ